MASETEELGSNPIKFENIRSVLCATCLSVNRVLHPVVALRDLVPLLNDVGLDLLNNSICWECRAIMDKFHKFKNQARRSISALNSLLGKNNNDIYNQVCSLSNLKQSNNKIYFDAQFSFEIKEEITDNRVNDLSVMINSQENTCFDIEPCHIKKEVFLLPSLPRDTVVDTVPIENSNRQLFITLLPLQVQSAGSNLAVPGTSLGIPSQLPSTPRKDSRSEAGSASDDDNHENNVDEVNEDDDEEAKRRCKSNKGKKPSTFSNTDFFTKILTEDEMLKYREQEREQKGFKNANFRCMSCILYFESKETLCGHNFLHCPIQRGQIACSICDQRFISQKDVTVHHLKHYTIYCCNYCIYSSYSWERLKRHWQRTHDSNANKQCVDCEKEFSSYRLLKYHREKAHREKPCCEECGKTFVTSTNLNRHMLLHKGAIPVVECAICHKKYRGRGGMRAHMRTHDKTQPENAYCTECDIQFKNKYLYHSHLKFNSRHGDPETFKFQCSYCGKKFISKTFLRNHIEAIHLKLNNYECEHCNRTFHNVVQLRRHQQNNHSDKPKTRNNICHLCGKAFIQKKSLTEHMNTHLGKRPFKCAECGATFTHSASLYTHNRLLHLKLKRGKKKTASTVD